MRRELDLNAVSDGKLYRQSDMVKAGCNDCKGCSDCCRGMGEILLFWILSMSISFAVIWNKILKHFCLML